MHVVIFPLSLSLGALRGIRRLSAFDRRWGGRVSMPETYSSKNNFPAFRILFPLFFNRLKLKDLLFSHHFTAQIT
ncbi:MULTISPECIES: hypothetical protein [Brucella]|uniref:hypothetical protein n=1 Tax=Brucella TaxID=234 RepID=UPI0002E87141|nr:hypothetical protein BKD03_02410 [Brucella sp. 09RB8471]